MNPVASAVVAGVVLAVTTQALRMAGPLLRGGRELSPRALVVVEAAGIVLLTAVAVTGAIYDDGRWGGWARPLGVGVAVLLALRGAPLPAVLVVAAGSTAGLRLLGVA